MNGQQWRGFMMRRIVILMLAFTLLGVGIAQAQDVDFWACPQGFEGQELHVYNWTTYLAEDTISNFEELCGVDLIYDTYGGDDEMLELLRQGDTTYDVVVPSDATVYEMVADSLMQPLDLDHIPNFAAITPELQNPPYDPGNVYTVPYQWGTVGIGYNRTRVGRDITSWRDLFEYDGAVAWLDNDRAMLGVVLLMLGYDPNTSDPTQIAEATAYLVANGTNVATIAPDDGQDWLERGDVDIAVEYNGDIFQLIANCNCDDYAYVIPEEGALVWVDNMAIPVGAPNKDLAEVFIDYILDAQTSADISNYTAYATPNQEAIDSGLVDEQYLSNPAIYPDADLMQKLFFAVANPELAALYSSAWEDVKSRVN
jgi:spermidine/putrescine transport system substrate-binding protein